MGLVHIAECSEEVMAHSSAFGEDTECGRLISRTAG